MKNNFVWLIGENLGVSCNNNSYYFWKNTVCINDNIDKYYVMEKTKRNLKIYQTLSRREKEYVLWRNSLKHFRLYFDADMYFVTLSDRDVRPERFFIKNCNFLTERPVVYLQHGLTAMKKIGYTGCDYNNNMFRFIYYNPQIKDKLINQNGFKEYQLYYGEYMPRYIELIKMGGAKQKDESKLNILWFMTWREYFGDNYKTELYIRTIARILNNRQIQNKIQNREMTIKVCLHQQFGEGYSKKIAEKIVNKNIVVCEASQINLMEEIADNDILITDYSSLGFDFTLLNKPVILFQNDIEAYAEKREFYCDIDELNKNNVRSEKELVDILCNRKFTVNRFFRSCIPKNIDYDGIESGKYIKKIYQYFSSIQQKQIAFLGYNFYGIGGTVSATKALAEGLLEKGYLIKLVSLKKTSSVQKMPQGLNMTSIYSDCEKTLREKGKRKLFRTKYWFKYLKYDCNRRVLIPYTEFGLKRWLKKTRIKTVISTRESLHLFLQDEKISGHIENRVYFFHTPPAIINNIYPGLMDKIEKSPVPTAIFVTENSRKGYESILHYNHYRTVKISGNCLESIRMIEKERINVIEEKPVYEGIWLLRFGEERVPDLENSLFFARYLKENNIHSIKVDIYGNGERKDWFLDILDEEELNEWFCWKGSVANPMEVFSKYDALIDFSVNQSFGMTYIEGIFNGKMVFCMDNPGSREVLGDFPECFMYSPEDFVNKMHSLPNISRERLIYFYNQLEKKYSRSTVAANVIDVIPS